MRHRALPAGWYCFGCGQMHADAIPYALSLAGNRYCPATYFRLMDSPQVGVLEDADMTDGVQVAEVSAEPEGQGSTDDPANGPPSDPGAFIAWANDMQSRYAAKRRAWYLQRRLATK